MPCVFANQKVIAVWRSSCLLRAVEHGLLSCCASSLFLMDMASLPRVGKVLEAYSIHFVQEADTKLYLFLCAKEASCKSFFLTGIMRSMDWPVIFMHHGSRLVT